MSIDAIFDLPAAMEAAMDINRADLDVAMDLADVDVSKLGQSSLNAYPMPQLYGHQYFRLYGSSCIHGSVAVENGQAQQLSWQITTISTISGSPVGHEE